MFLDFIAPFLIGLAGSLHCLGMCGPLVMAYSLHIRSAEKEPDAGASALWMKGVSHHVAFHLGRLCTYGMLGGLAAGLAHLAVFNQALSNLRGWATLGGGTLMILSGLILFKILPLPAFSSGASNFFFTRWIPFLLHSRRLPARLALGVAVGFLPCMLSWAMIVKAATASSPFHGSLTTLAFGLGTVPALFFTGLSASLLSFRVRFLGERAAAAAVIIMGCILIFKGGRYFA
jgi:sulfite exporter TauE/SafE